MAATKGVAIAWNACAQTALGGKKPGRPLATSSPPLLRDSAPAHHAEP